MADVEKSSAQEEYKFLHYTGNAIPWFVRVIWILFWAYAITYVVQLMLPAIQTELISPP